MTSKEWGELDKLAKALREKANAVAERLGDHPRRGGTDEEAQARKDVSRIIGAISDLQGLLDRSKANSAA